MLSPCVTVHQPLSTSCRLNLKVSPKAARNAINGWHGEQLKIAVTAPPDKGKANDAVIKLLAEHLDLPKSALVLIRGHTSTQKLIAIEGVEEGELLRRLGHPAT